MLQLGLELVLKYTNPNPNRNPVGVAAVCTGSLMLIDL